MATPRTAARKSPAPPVPAGPARPPRAARPAGRAAAPAPKPAAAAAPAPAPKETRKRVRLVRDSFTMPEDDLALVAALKARALKSQRETKKSEVVRAAIRTLAAMDDAALLAALSALAPIKVGRPKKGH